MPEQERPGVILKTKFVMPGALKFKTYIDYIDRDEAVRNEAFGQYSAYVDGYMDNPEKQKERYGFSAESERTSALFTAGHDQLTAAEKQNLKHQFRAAQKSGSCLWQTVISFDNAWLEEQGVYDQKALDEGKVRELTRGAMNVMLREEGMEHSAVWSASIHYNTDNIHIHIAAAEPHPTREKILYHGKETYRSKLKPKTLEKMKSSAVNSVVSRSAELQRINGIIRDNIIAAKKAMPSIEDKRFRDGFLRIYYALPKDRRLWKYGMNGLQNVLPMLDAFTKEYLKTNHGKDLEELQASLSKQQEFLRRAYGEGSRERYKDYAENKMQELYKRLGNAVLSELREYDKKTKEPPAAEKESEQLAVQGVQGEEPIKAELPYTAHPDISLFMNREEALKVPSSPSITELRNPSGREKLPGYLKSFAPLCKETIRKKAGGTMGSKVAPMPPRPMAAHAVQRHVALGRSLMHLSRAMGALTRQRMARNMDEYKQLLRKLDPNKEKNIAAEPETER